ncbi:MAG: hypothetical protein ABSA64_05200 [Sedimentisphaerales bacterium]
MRKLLLLVFVAMMCVPSYGSILVYRTTETATVLDTTGSASLGKVTEKGYLVISVNLDTQDVCEAQQITHTGTGGATLRALAADVVFYKNVAGNIVADYSSGNTNAVLFGKTSNGKSVGLTDKNVARTLTGYTVDFTSPTFSSGTFSATLDTALTKNNQSTLIDNLVSNLITSLTKYTLVTDTTPPTPSPMTWAPGGEPNAISNTQITMTATTATDALTPPVQYYFTNKTLTGHDSGWISDTTWTDGGLQSNTLYTYNVMAEDSKAPVPNVTTKSADANATTHSVADTLPPDPNPATWAVRPTTVSDTSITMTATTATAHQGEGVQYYFRNKNGTGGHDSGWQDSATYLDHGLIPDTNYGYTVKAKTKALVPYTTNESVEANAVTGHDTTAPDPNPATFAIAPHATGATTIAMQATIATDASNPVWYRFYRSAPIGNTFGPTAWQTDSNWTDTGLAENTTYSYMVQSKDSATTPNIGAWSTAAPSATTAKTIQGQINAAIVARGGASTTPPYQLVTVPIAAGTYAESIDICEPNITLVGAGATTTIIEPGANYQQAVEVNKNAEYATIDGFTIKYGTQAYTGSNPSQSVIWVHANNSTIQNCVIDTNSDTIAGILIGGRVANVPNGGAGKIAIWGYNVATPSKGHKILNNTFHSFSSGESVGIWAVKLSDDSVISGNTFNGDANDSLSWGGTNAGGPGTGIVIHSAAKGSGTHAVTIQSNTAQYLKYSFLTFIADYFYNDSVGKKYEEPEDSDVNDVLVTGNTVHNIGTLHTTGDSAGDAIGFMGARAASDAYVGGSGDLIIDAGGVAIQSNTFSNNGYGVWIKVPKNYNSGASYGCVFDANHITIGANNSISGNNIYGVYNGTVDATQEAYHGSTVVDVNAALNWWGDVSGPYPHGSGDAVDANVIYYRYWTNAAMTDPNI